MREKSRALWIHSGDLNTIYFHSQWKIKSSIYVITSVHTEAGARLTKCVDIEAKFISFFSNLMGNEREMHLCIDPKVDQEGYCLYREH